MKPKLTPKTEDSTGIESDYADGYKEKSRKTKAFYVSLAAIIALFIYGDIRGIDTKDVIVNVSNLALSYIVGVAATDSVRYYKYGSNTLKNPESPDLKKRYEDK